MNIISEWPGYRTKARNLLFAMQDSPGRFQREGEWFKLGREENVGAKLLIWMVENGLLECRHDNRHRGSPYVVSNLYRLSIYPEPDDLGDLWIE